LRDESGQKLHISQKLTDAQVLNSPLVKSARVQMMEGEWPLACERCRQSEEASDESARKHLNSRFSLSRQTSLLRDTEADGSLQNPVVRYADIRLGNVCNLTCRMCGPIASRLWAENYNEIQPDSYRMAPEELKVLGQNNWVKHESVSWLLEQCLPYLETLHFAGGEPLILPEMVEALELLARSGRAGEISLVYNTNLTVLPEKVTSLWHHFRSVSVLCSVDGFGRMNEYIRRPSKWNDIDSNLRKLDQNFKEWHIDRAAISSTIQIYNVLTIDQLFEYVRSAKFSHLIPVPQLVPLFYPQYLSVQALPASAKAVARQRLERELERAEALNSGDLTVAIASIQATLSFMDAAETMSDLPDFLAFTQSSDRVFGDSLKEAAPELVKHLDAMAQPKERGFQGILQGIFRRGA